MGNENDNQSLMPVVTVSALQALTEAEMLQEFNRATQRPRSITNFRRKVEEMATLSPSIAAKLFFRVKRGKDYIEGPSVRLAEIAMSCYGNLRVGARIIDIGEKEVTAQGMAHDLETNVMYQAEVKRGIVTSDGKRYSQDMIIMTCNAACAIATRNATFKVVPMVLVEDAIQKAKKVAKGDAATFPERRKNAVDAVAAKGVAADRVLLAMDKKGLDDITLDDMVDLAGLLSQLDEGSMTAE